MEDRIKTDVIRTRIDVETKEKFMTICDRKGCSPSKILRLLIQSWIADPSIIEQTNN